jgi:hypothetical protein
MSDKKTLKMHQQFIQKIYEKDWKKLFNRIS